MPAATAPSEYLKRPYGRVVVPESDGTFRAEIMEFPGCIATGDTAAEALASLENVAESWLEATTARGQHVPEPMEGGGFSGKLVVRLGRDLHRRAAHMAAHEGVSLNQFIVSSVAEHVGSRLAVGHVLQMATLPSPTTFFIYPGQLYWGSCQQPRFVRSNSRASEQVNA
jgi:predicted RNase H-like HicB family nuclease